MEFIRGLANILQKHQGCYLTIGNFDGVHLGHQAILRRVVELAKQKNCPSMVMIFEPSPKEYFLKDNSPARITLLRDKVEQLKLLDIDFLLCIHFNHDMAQLSAENFVKEILYKKLKIHSLVIGDDFHFGKNRVGDFDFLTQRAEEFGFGVQKLSSVMHREYRVSSSNIRSALDIGDFQSVRQWLNRPFSITGRVIHGQKRGRLIGVPTANIPLWHHKPPINGVFVVHIHGIDNSVHKGVASVGKQPAVGGERELLEAYIFDYSGNLYGKMLRVEFLKKLRDISNFSSFASLSEQIQRDIMIAKDYFD